MNFVDGSWIVEINNPLALIASIIFIVTCALALIWSLSSKQNSKLVDKFLTYVSEQNTQILDVVKSNTAAGVKQAESIDANTSAISRLTDVVDKKLKGNNE